MNKDRLLEIARQTGLRHHLHGANAVDARELLAQYVTAVLADPQALVCTECGARHAAGKNSLCAI